MKNELFSIGPITIYGYGLMIAIGVLAAYFSATYRAKKYDLDPDKVFYVTVWAVIGGFGGAKLLYLITQLPAILQNPSLLKDVRDGFVVYGGIIGGILAAWIYCKVAKLKFMKYFDLVMPSVALAQGFGRIGCFLAGCCYGKETESAFHIIFHDSAYAPNNVPLIPTQLISSGLDFLNCIFLMWFAGKKKGDGQVAGLYLICYSVGRFVLEFFRGDLERGSVGSLSTSQFIAIFTAIAGVVLFLWFGKRKTEEKEIQEETAEMARRSVAHNHLEDRINIVTGDIKEAAERFKPAFFDVITTNPPYMLADHGLRNPDDSKAIARHEVLCTLDDILRESMRLLQDKGRFYMIHRPFRLTEILTKMHEYKIEPKRIQFIHPYIDKEPTMVLVEGMRGAKPRVTIEPPIIMYAKDGTLLQKNGNNSEK